MNNFNKELIIITAVWCSSCLVMMDITKKVTSNFPHMQIKKLDYDLDEAEVKKYNVGTTLPVFIINDSNGNELKRLVGEHTLEEMNNFLLDI